MLTVFIILAITLLLFVTQWIRYDLVAIFSVSALVIFGCIPAEGAFNGFGNPAVITVAAVLVISEALSRSGFVDLLANGLNWTRRSLGLQITVLCIIVALLSGIMNNVGALALIMPVAVRLAYLSNRSVTHYLMPIAFSSILGGLFTLIGTPANLIISSVRQKAGGEVFTMFDFLPVGGIVAFGGVLFLGFIGWRLVPKRKDFQEFDKGSLNIKNYLTELWIDDDSPLLGESLGLLKSKYEDLIVIALVRNSFKHFRPKDFTILRAGDRLIVEMGVEELEEAMLDLKLNLAKKSEMLEEGTDHFQEEGFVLKEAIVTGASGLNGRSIRDAGSFSECSVLAVARHGSRLTSRINRIRFSAGDLLLIHGQAENIDKLVDRFKLLTVGERVSKPRTSVYKIAFGVAIFLVAISIVIMGWLPVQTSLLLCAGLLVLFRFLTVQEAYASIDWGVIILLGALFPLGDALERSGGAYWIAQQVLILGQGGSVTYTLFILMTGTMLLSNVINNAAAAVLMAPIALSVAKSLEINPDQFLMGIAISASCAFLTPIGHQSNTMVMEPGGYKFLDYTKVGLPLTILILGLATWAIPFFWG